MCLVLSPMRVSDFDFELPAELIAQAPASERGTSRLLVVDRTHGELTDRHVSDLPELLTPGDLIVINDTRVIPARLLGQRVPTGGAVECLLLSRLEGDRWDVLMHPGQKLREGSRVVFTGGGFRLHGEVLARRFHGRRTVSLWTNDGVSVDHIVDTLGHIPLPPYIKRPDGPTDRDRYQTVYALTRGSVAAPTAGLHLTMDLLQRCLTRGIEVARVTLHVGYGTFSPVRVERVEDHAVEPERYHVPAGTAEAVNRAVNEGRRVVAIGTTTTRTLETAARVGRRGYLSHGGGVSELFLYPGMPFHLVNALFTNFHLPQSSLLFLVSAFAGRDRVLKTYTEAVRRRYRFYSYGDAMLIL